MLCTPIQHRRQYDESVYAAADHFRNGCKWYGVGFPLLIGYHHPFFASSQLLAIDKQRGRMFDNQTTSEKHVALITRLKSENCFTICLF